MLLWFNKDKPNAEGSEQKKETETETLIFSETTAARQKVPDKHNKLTDHQFNYLIQYKLLFN